VKKLLEVNVGHPRFAKVPDELKYLVLELKRDMDVARMMQQIVGGEPTDRDEKPVMVKGILDSYFGKNILAPKLKAFGSTVSGAGDEWVPTGISASYIEEYQLEHQVARQFRQINMPTDPYDLPVQKDVTEARIQAEGSGLTGANFGTDKIRLDAIKLTEFMVLPEELNEDSAPDILGLVRSEVIEAQIRAVEQAIINGDSDGTHQDYDTHNGAANLAAKAWDGLIKLGMANSANGGNKDFSGAAVDVTKLRDMRTKMKKYGVNPRELVWLVSTKVYNQFLGLSDVTTVEKFGPMATILQGALAALDGIPIVISEYMRDNVAATGFNTMAGPNTFSRIALVNKQRFFFGVRRPIRVKAVMDPTPPNDQWLLCSWWRGDFKGHAQSATEISVVTGYNIV
jgi:HK97 family phage major capsid protein